jgi:hypothetical protein
MRILKPKYWLCYTFGHWWGPYKEILGFGDDRYEATCRICGDILVLRKQE